MFGRTGAGDRRFWSSATPVIDAALRLAFAGEPGAVSVSVYVLDAGDGSWHFVTGTDPAADGDPPHAPAELVDLTTEPLPIDGLTAYPLRGSRRLLGALVVAEPYERGPRHADLVRCVADALDAADARTYSIFVKQAARAVRRLFVESAHAADVQDAGAVLARIAAETFRTERAGVYVIDDGGTISFAVGVGASGELSEALTRALVGRKASTSRMWGAIVTRGGPVMVDDSRSTPLLPGGFVNTLGICSYTAIPLMSADGPLGMVVCGDTRARTWTRREKELADQFALEAALIVDAARLRTSQRDQLAQLSHLAYHDGLTGLANRRHLMKCLDDAVLTAKRDGSTSAVLLLDLDDFKRVNDTLGHRYGDDLLREVSARLRATLRPQDTLSRLGGDEFAIVLSGDCDRAQALAAAARVTAALAEPMDLEGVPVTAGASVGIAMLPEEIDGAEDLLQHADIAMYAAKRRRAGAVVYDSSLNHATLDRLALDPELRYAIAHDELRLHFQPKLDLRRNVVTGVESLVRWQHPRRGLLGPGEFLPMAEAGELIHPLTEWVVEHSLRQQAEWAGHGVHVDLAVNISARNLLDNDLLARLKSLIGVGRTKAKFVVEVTETSVMTNPEQSIRALHELREAGAMISMDDFGTGQSSLALLSQLPVDELKIDRQLVSQVRGTEQDHALVDTIVHLGHQLGLSVVAEGIETSVTLQALRDLGCDVGQGYLISPPVSPDACFSLLSVPRLESPIADAGAGDELLWG